MKNFLWGLAARILSLPPVARWLIRRAQRTPYTPLGVGGPGGVYMWRYWVYNRYDGGKPGAYRPEKASVRVQHIVRPDRHPDNHNHPWLTARTLILSGWYVEVRETDGVDLFFTRRAGDTAQLDHGVFHRIVQVSPGGVHTLFITGRKTSSWGFKEGGKLTPWREYLAARK